MWLLLRSFSVMFLWNKSGKVGRLEKGVKSVFIQVKRNMWKRWCLGVAVLSMYRNHPIYLLCKLMGGGGGGFYVMLTLAWISKVDEWLRSMSIFRYFLIASSTKKKMMSAYCFLNRKDVKKKIEEKNHI